MRLFEGESTKILHFSQEQFNAYYQNATVISEEAISDFFYKLKDSLSTIQNRLVNSNHDRIVTDTLSTRFETEHVLNRLNFLYIKDELIAKPENFKGKYVYYIADLILASEEVVKNTESTLNSLKLAISGFINEYSENSVQTLYGGVYFKEANKLVEKTTKDIAKYFPTKNNSVNAEVGDLLKSFKDIPIIYTSIQTLENILNESKINNISKLANEASELVDVLIEQNTSSGILLKNDYLKKELVNALHICGKQVELVSYLFSNAIFFYSAFKKLSELLIAKANVK